MGSSGGALARRARFEGLYGAHGRAILAFALRRAEQPADAADVLAEVFLVAWRRLDDVLRAARGLSPGARCGDGCLEPAPAPGHATCQGATKPGPRPGLLVLSFLAGWLAEGPTP